MALTRVKDTQVTFKNGATGSVVQNLGDKLRESVSVKDFGAVGDGVADDTAAIQAAIDAFSYGGGKVYLPAGTYKVTSQITISKDRLHVVGDGQGATKIVFSPSASAVCFLVDKGASVAYQGSFKGLSFYSNDTTYTKTAIKLIDCSGYAVEDCGTLSPHWTGAGSIFLNIQGRENGWVRNIHAAADRPIVVDPIPSPHTPSGIGIDHHNFHNCYLIAGNYPVITFSSGLILTQVSFTGAQAWVGGTDGLNWVDTTSTQLSNGLLIENVRWEQGVSSANWLINIQHNYALQGLTIIGGQGGDRNGIYLRKVSNVSFKSFYYTNDTGVALNVDSTVDEFSGENCFWQAGSTATITGQTLYTSTPKRPNTGALPPNFAYTLSTNTSTATVGPVTSFTPSLNSFTQVVGGGSITATGSYQMVGKRCYVNVQIACTGGATIASTANTSHITGTPSLPTASVQDCCYATNGSTAVDNGVGLIQGLTIYTPTWAAQTGTVVVSGNYLVA